MQHILAFLKNLPRIPYFYCQRFCKWIEICARHATSPDVQWWYPFIIPFWIVFWIGLMPNPIELIPVVTFFEFPDIILTIFCLIALQTGLPKQLKLEYRQEVKSYWDRILDRIPNPIQPNNQPQKAIPILNQPNQPTIQARFLKNLNNPTRQKNDKDDNDQLKIKFYTK